MANLVDSSEVMGRFSESLELVEIVARQVARSLGPHVEHADLVSFGREGLLLAARRFDPERGVPFRSYANYRVRGAIFDGVRKMAAMPRRAHERLRALQAADDVSLGALEDVSSAPAERATPKTADEALSEHLAAMATAMAVGLIAEPVFDGDTLTTLDRSPSPEQAAEHGELVAQVEGALGELPKEEAHLIRRHYFEGRPFEELATELGLSKSWASRLHTRALGRLSRLLGSPSD